MASIEDVVVAAETVAESSSAPTETTIAEGVPEVQTKDASSADASDEQKLLRAAKQIEFYFADSNLPYDRFMWTLHTADPDHWVPIATVASFKRMREFVPLGHPWIVKALHLSTELEVDETNTKVRRRTEVQEPKGQFERSAYAKGFGEEVPGLQQRLEDFFNKYGKVNAVRMRRIEQTKEFKGSVFVEFEDYKSVHAFVTAEPKPSWDGKELLIMSKEDYCDMKIQEKGLTGKAAAFRRESMAGPGRKGFNAFKEMAQKADEKNGKKQAKDKAKPEIWLEFMGNKIRVHEEDGGSLKKEEVPLVRGSSLKFEGCGEDVSFDEIKAPLKERFARAPFVKYNRGDNWGLLGFDKALTEEEITFVKEKLNTLSSKTISWSVPDEEQERDFQYERANSAAKRAVSFSQRGDRGGRGGGRGGRGRGGRGGGRGGRGGGRRRDDNGKAATVSGLEGEATGDKRKRAVEPDGGPHTGVRGSGVPVIQSAKKTKTENSAAS